MSTTSSEIVTLGQLPEEEKKKHLAALADVLTDDDKDINLDEIEVVDDEQLIPTPMEPHDEQHLAAMMQNNKVTMPAPTKQIGPNGVMQIYPAKQGGPAYYLGDDFEKDKIQITYGGTIVKYTTSKWNNITVFNSAGWPITYKSGSKPSRSLRVNTYPVGGIKNNKTNFSWDNNPGYLYKPEGPRNTSLTIYVNPHGRLGTHESCAGKKAGREEDAIRSLAEIVYPTQSHSEAQFNWNFSHFPYVNGKMVIIKKVPVIEVDKWLGLQYIHVVANDGKAGHWELWADLNPFGPNGEILNNWEKIAEYDDFGCKEYKNIPVGWNYMRDVFRGDGFKNWEFCLLSDYEIDVSGNVITPPPPPPPPPGPPVDKEPISEEAIVIQYLKSHPDKLAAFETALGIGGTPPTPTDQTATIITAAIEAVLKTQSKETITKVLATLNQDFK